MSRNLNFKYLPAIEHDCEWGLIVNCAGTQEILPGEMYPPAEHPLSYRFLPTEGRMLNEFQLIYCAKGEGTFHSETAGTMKVSAGDIILLYPNERHTYYPNKDTGWKEFWIGFHGKNIDTRVQNGFFNPAHPLYHLPIGMQDDVIGFYNNSINAAQHMKKGYQQLLSGYVNMLLGYILSADGENNPAEKEITESIHQAMLYIHSNYTQDIKAIDVAERIHWGYSKFRKVFLQQTGKTPYQYIQEVRIKKSKNLLENSTKPLKEIAYEVGFSSPDYFSTAFRRVTGVAPMNYRKHKEAK